jgi:hypothetical protein
MLAFAIPRGVSVLATGEFVRLENDSDEININVSAKLDGANPGIVQSSFMNAMAKTTEFKRELRIVGNTLSYSQETTVNIYNKVFNHADDNILQRA